MGTLNNPGARQRRSAAEAKASEAEDARQAAEASRPAVPETEMQKLTSANDPVLDMQAESVRKAMKRGAR